MAGVTVTPKKVTTVTVRRDATTGKLGDAPITASGLGKAAATGLRGGSEGLAGFYGDIPDYAGGGVGWLAQKLGVDEATAQKLAEQVAYGTRAVTDPRSKIEAVSRWLGYSDDTGELPRIMPTSGDVNQAITEAYPDERTRELTQHQPQNRAEQATETLTSMIPSMGRTGILRGVIAPTIGSEVGGFLGEQVGEETLGRLLGGVGGGLVPEAGMRTLTGGRMNAERERLVRALQERGVELTGGQATGVKALQYAEAGPFETKPRGLAERQGEQFNRAALEEAGINADRATPDTIQAARDNFGTEYEALIQRTGGLPLDGQMTTDLVTLVDDYERLKGFDASPAVDSYFRRISDAARDNNNVIPTDVFRQIRSDISKDLRKLKDDPTLAQTLRDFQDALYGSIERNAAPGTEQAWRDINRRYRNFKTIEKSMLGAGADTAEGMISPSKLRTAVQGSDQSGYLSERGDLTTLARAGENVMKPLPQSGTTPHAYIAGTGAGVGGALLSGNPLAAAGIAGGAAIPPAISSILTSRPVRTRIIRSAMGEGPLPMDPLTAALLIRQSEAGGQ